MRCVLTVIIAFLSTVTLAQESTYAKFGQISPEALHKKSYSVDSLAPAVVLSDIGHTSIEGNYKGWFSAYSMRHKVIHILNNAGYDEANIEIPLYSNGDNEENLEFVNAVTYNLENGKIVTAKLDVKDIFTERRGKNVFVKKFAFPAVKAGSILEYQYKVSSDFLNNLDAWTFQGSLPVLWSEYIFSVPDFFSYRFLLQGYSRPFLKAEKSRTEVFAVHGSLSSSPTQTSHFRSRVTDKRWVFKNLPELKGEDYVTTLANHVAKLDLQLISRNKPLVEEDYRQSWTDLTNELIKEFGLDNEGDSLWFARDAEKIAGTETNETEKAKRLFRFVRDQFVCTGNEGIIQKQSAQTTLRKRKGSAAELNLLLIQLLRSVGIWSDPVILSTTDHGYALEEYPNRSRFNYVVVRALTDDKFFYLDASHNRLGFARLLPECYNGHARVVNNEATPVFLSADSLHDVKQTNIFLANGRKTLWEGTMTQLFGQCESYQLREEIKDQGAERFFRQRQAAFEKDVLITDPGIDSLNNYDESIALRYNIVYNPVKNDLINLNLMFGEEYKMNPFKSAKRMIPVELPYTTDETFSLTLEVPEGYEVAELPKQLRAKLDESGNTFFEYLVQSSGGFVSLRSRIKIGRTFFAPEEYENLRGFFDLIVKKQAEQIVFKRK